MISIFNHWKFAHFAAFGMLLFVVGHVFFIHLPPTGNHVWRQSNSLALAKNFYEEDMNILEPRVDKRNMKSGVTGTNFPLYEWTLACSYKVFGFHHGLHRVYALLISLLSFLMVYLVFKERSEEVGRVAAWIFLFNPLVFYYGFSALPDMMAILLILFANLLVIRIFKNPKWYLYLLIVLFSAIALMIKFTYVLWLVIPFVMVDYKEIRTKLVPLSISFFFALIPVVIWYKYANYLTQVSGGLVEFVYQARIIDSFADLKLLGLGLLSSIPEMLLGYPGLVLLVLALLFAQEKKNKVHWVFKMGAIILVGGYLLAASQNLINHDYYLLPFLGLLIVAMSTPIARYKHVVPLLLLLMPIWAFIRIAPSNWIGEEVSKYADARDKLKVVVAKQDRVICGPDQTGSYLFYMLDVKGFPYEKVGDLTKEKKGILRLQELRDAGADYLITNHKADLTKRDLVPFYNEITYVGDSVWAIKLVVTNEL